jgi:(1->4)-alpha-D-glucan 1-alpha-D-glucosylmutase
MANQSNGPVAQPVPPSPPSSARTPRTPVATYRVQLTASFGFRALEAIVDYLHELGITDVYASPFLQARPGSTHGYDVVDHRVLNQELGDDAAMANLHARLASRGMGLVADVVPNHMCVNTNDNVWWNDVLENGPSSPYAKFFDIDFRPPKSELKDKVVLPLLGDQYGKVLENGELSLVEDAGALWARYGDRRFPIGPSTYNLVLRVALDALRGDQEGGAGESAVVVELESIMTAVEHLPHRGETDAAKVRERQREKEIVKSRLRAWLAEQPGARAALDTALARTNGVRGDPRSFDTLEALLARQAYRLSYWQVAAEQINYRRFFDINDLAAIRVEEPDVLEAVHAKIFELLRAGSVTALRVDHVDGLREPRRYLDDLAERAGHPYVVVEKILGFDERLPEGWAAAGTTGYEFLNLVGGLFVDAGGEKALRVAYDGFRTVGGSYEDIVFDAKRLVLETSMASELQVMARRLDRISEQHRWSRDFTVGTLAQALTDTIAAFPVYRTYASMDDAGLSSADERHVVSAIEKAKRRSPGINGSVFDFLEDVLLMRHPDGVTDAQRAERKDFVLRFQELTGPVMAKGVEDTTFYRYFPLLSLNEVGGGPRPFGTEPGELHRRMVERARERPTGMSATSTHDTKRAEDARSRLHVLSELADEWAVRIEEWRALADRLKPRVAGAPVPDDDDEYYVYQTILGALPETEGGVLPDDFVPRVQAAVEKALREAKRHTTWVNQNKAYEEAVRVFIERLLDPKEPLRERILAFTERLRAPGYWGALSQLVVKATAPGVPDFFQGTELWDFSMVDPDNRRPVDFALRTTLLEGLAKPARARRTALIADLARTIGDGRMKLFVTQACLGCRRERADLFLHGSYFPLVVEGPRRDHVFAFARRKGSAFAVTVVARLFAKLGGPMPPPKEAWEETTIRWPQEIAAREVDDAISGQARGALASSVRVSEILDVLPFCVLVGQS